MYRGDNSDINCPQRLCPDTPADPYGLSSPVPSGSSAGSPRPPAPTKSGGLPPTNPTQVPDGIPGAGFKNGLLSPFLGTTNNANSIFTCAVEQQWQCGYALNYTTGSPAAQRDSFVTEQVRASFVGIIAGPPVVGFPHHRSAAACLPAIRGHFRRDPLSPAS